jgi:hypothetical protein
MSNCGCRVEGVDNDINDINIFKFLHDNLPQAPTPSPSGDEYTTGYLPQLGDATSVPAASPPVSRAEFNENKPFLKPDCSKGTIKTSDGTELECWKHYRDWKLYNISKNEKFVNDFLPKYTGGQKGDVNKCYEVWLPSESYLGLSADTYINNKVARDVL